MMMRNLGLEWVTYGRRSPPKDVSRRFGCTSDSGLN